MHLVCECPALAGSVWLVYITSNLVHLLVTSLALSDSQKQIALPRLWHRGQMKMSAEASAPQVALSLAEFSHVCHLGVGEKAH